MSSNRQLAESTSQYLMPALKYLITREKEDEAKAEKELGTDAWSRACILWDRLSPLIKNIEAFNDDLLKQNGYNEWGNILASKIEEILESNPKVAKDIQDLGEYSDKSFNDNLLKITLLISKDIKDDKDRVESIINASAKIPEPQKSILLENALESLSEIKDKYDQATLKIKILKLMPISTRKLDLIIEILGNIEELEDPLKRIQLYVLAIGLLPEPLKTTVLNNTLKTASSIEGLASKAVLLGNIANELPDLQKNDILYEALSYARDISDEESRAEVLITLIPSLPPQSKSFAWDLLHETIKNINYDLKRAKFLDRSALIAGQLGPNLASIPSELDKLERMIKSDNLRKPSAAVFLIYTEEDKNASKYISKNLSEEGLVIYPDYENIPLGSSWLNYIDESMKKTDLIILIVGKGPKYPWDDPFIRSILWKSVEQDKKIIPLILEDAKNVPELPIFIRNRVAVDFRDKGSEPMKKLISGIKAEKSITG